MNDVLMEVDGQVRPLTDCCWVEYTACGCPVSVVTADWGNDDIVLATEAQARKRLCPTKRERDKAAREGYRLELMSFDRYRTEVDLAKRCPHLKGDTTQATLDAAEPTCSQCPTPVQPGTPYCSTACRNLDDKHDVAHGGAA